MGESARHKVRYLSKSGLRGKRGRKGRSFSGVRMVGRANIGARVAQGGEEGRPY